MKLKKIGLGLNVLILPLVSITTVISCTKKTKKEDSINLIKPNDLGYPITAGKEKPSALGDNPTKNQIETYNSKMNVYNADQLTQEKTAVLDEIQAKGFGFTSTQGVKKPTTLTGTPKKVEIDAYNAQMKKYNDDQLAQEQDAFSNKIKAKGFGFTSTQGKEMPAPLTGAPKKVEIDAYNAQMKKYNADQLTQDKVGVSGEIQAVELGFTSTKGNKKPSILTEAPTKDQIDAYNTQMEKYNADQLVQENIALNDVVKARGLNFTSTQGNEMPAPLTETPTKDQIDAYNAQMKKYNADQFVQENGALDGITKARRLEFTSTQGNEMPAPLTETPTKDQIDAYNAQMKKYNADQFVQENGALDGITKARRLEFTSTQGNEMPAPLTGTPTKDQIDAYNAQMKKYNADQFVQENGALDGITKARRLEFTSTQGNEMPAPLTGTPTKDQIDAYNAQMKKYNADQFVQENGALDGITKARRLEFTSTQGNEMPAPLTGTPTKDQIDAYNAQMEKYNDDQIAQSRKASSTLVVAIGKNFTPTKGMEKPVTLTETPTKDQIYAYNAQMIKYNKDQFVQSLIIANLKEIDFSKALIKAKNLGFDKPTKGNKKPTHNQYFETLKVNQDDLNEKLIFEIYDYIKSYNAQMKKYNADQFVQENGALDGITKARGLNFTSTQGNEMPAPLTGTPTKDQIDAYNAQMEKYNDDQIAQSRKASSTLVVAIGKNFTPTKGMEKPATLTETPIKDQIYAYNAQMIKYNKDQFVQSLIIANLKEIDFSKALIKAKNLGFDKPTKGNKKPAHNQYFETLKVNQDDLNEKLIFEIYDYIKSYNAQMEKYNDDQIAQSRKASSTLVVAIGKNFTPTKGMEKPVTLTETPTKDQIYAYNAQMIKYNKDQFVQSLIIANLKEIDFSKALIKAKNLGFDKPTKGNKKPTHNQYFETLKVNQDDLNEKLIFEIYDYIKSYNAQMEKYNADQFVQENGALDGITKAIGLEFTSTQGNEMPAPLTGTPTKTEIDAYNAQMEKYNDDQLNQENIALNDVVKARGLNFTSTQGNEMPAPLTGTPTKTEIDAYNVQMKKFKADQISLSNAAKEKLVHKLVIENGKALIKAMDLGYNSTTNNENPLSIILDIFGYNLTQSQIDENPLFWLSDLLGDNLTQSQLDEVSKKFNLTIYAYNTQTEKYNADQLAQENIALNDVAKEKGLKFTSTQGNEMPAPLIGTPTKDQIDAYNAQMIKYNADQLAQLNKAKSTLIEAKDLGYVSSIGSEWVDKTDLPATPTKDQIDAYNAQMKKFNANQSFLSSIAKERVIKSLLKGQNLIKAKYLGFVSTEGNENPFALMKDFLGYNPTASEIKERMTYFLIMGTSDYNAQMAKYNADQVDQSNKAKSTLVKTNDLGYPITVGKEKPNALGKNPSLDQINIYNIQAEAFNADQIRQSKIAKANLVKAKDLGFNTAYYSIAYKPKDFNSDSPKKDWVEEYNQEMREFNDGQVKAQEWFDKIKVFVITQKEEIKTALDGETYALKLSKIKEVLKASIEKSYSGLGKFSLKRMIDECILSKSLVDGQAFLMVGTHRFTIETSTKDTTELSRFRSAIIDKQDKIKAALNGDTQDMNIDKVKKVLKNNLDSTYFKLIKTLIIKSKKGGSIVISKDSEEITIQTSTLDKVSLDEVNKFMKEIGINSKNAYSNLNFFAEESGVPTAIIIQASFVAFHLLPDATSLDEIFEYLSTHKEEVNALISKALNINLKNRYELVKHFKNIDVARKTEKVIIIALKILKYYGDTFKIKIRNAEILMKAKFKQLNANMDQLLLKGLKLGMPLGTRLFLEKQFKIKTKKTHKNYSKWLKYAIIKVTFTSDNLRELLRDKKWNITVTFKKEK